MKTIFSERLSKILDDKGMKQNELADLAQTTEATVSRYLSGERAPHTDVLVAIAKNLNVSVDYLLGVTDVPYVNSALSTEESILVSAYNRVSDRDYSIIWQLLEPYLKPSERGLLRQSDTTDKRAEA